MLDCEKYAQLFQKTPVASKAFSSGKGYLSIPATPTGILEKTLQ